MIREMLEHGAKNARTGRELAKILNCGIREITAAVERERRDGAPICASSDTHNPGYYLASSAEELESQIKRINKRAGEMHKTRRALIKVLQQIQAAKDAQTE